MPKNTEPVENEGGELTQITEADVADFRRHAYALTVLIRRIKKRQPMANYYLDGTNMLHLMSDKAFTGSGTTHQERIVASERIENATGGDW